MTTSTGLRDRAEKWKAELEALVELTGESYFSVRANILSALLASPAPAGAEVREAVARAICREQGHHPDGAVSYCNPGPRWKGFLREAGEFLAEPRTKALIECLAASPAPAQATPEAIREFLGDPRKCVGVATHAATPPAEARDPRCTCGLVRRSIKPEEHDDSCPVVAGAPEVRG